MQTVPGKRIALLTVSLMLSACGGGGGGGGTVPSGTPIVTTPFTKWSDVDPGVNYKADGRGQEVSGISSGGVFTSINPASSESAGYSATLTFDQNDKLTRLILTTPSTLVNFDQSAGATFTDLTLASSGSIPQFVGAISSTSVAVMANPIDLGWEYQSFGVWETGLGTSSRTFGAMSVGAPTIGTAIPFSITATSVIFTGYATGSYVNAAGTGTTAFADLTVTADFGPARSLDFKTTNTQTSSNWDTPTPTFTPNSGLNLSGTLTYDLGTNRFTGSVTGSGLTGNSTGQFYGPNAEELGGVFFLKGTGPIETYAGAYGAKQ